MVDRGRLFGEREGVAERIAPGFFWSSVEDDHLARYHWAAPLLRGKGVLDVACGTGYGAEVLRKGGVRAVVSVDVSEDALRFGAVPFALQAVLGDAQRLPFRDQAFGGCVSFETIEHVPEAEFFARELARVLRPGGPLLLSTPNVLRSAGDNPHHVKEFTLGELTVLLASAGLSVLRVEGQHWRAQGVLWQRVPGFRRLGWALERPARVTSLALPRSEPLYWCLQAVKT